MANIPSELSFKFKYVKNGHAQGIFAQKAVASQEAIALGTERLIYEDITDSTTRDNRLILAISPTASVSQKVSQQLMDGRALVLEVYKIKAIELEKFIDRLSSKKQADLNRQRLTQAGEGHLFYSVNCPECDATIDLSRLDRTNYVYCRFCESIFDSNQSIPTTQGSKYCLCDECNMFDRVQGYTEFYFYFLVIIYGFSYKRRYLCDRCANGLFWKTLLINFIFMLGIIPSIWIKIKSLKGRDRDLKELSKANALAKKGQPQAAMNIYHRLQDRYPNHPGLLMNEGLGYLLANNITEAANCFNRSISYCSNYYPVIRLIDKIQTTLSEKK